MELRELHSADPQRAWPSRHQAEVTVGWRSLGGGEEELLGPVQVLTPVESEHGGDKPGGGRPSCYLRLPGLRLSRSGKVPRRARALAVTDCRDTKVRKRVRTETVRRWVHCPAMCLHVSSGYPDARWRAGRLAGRSRFSPKVCRPFANWPATCGWRRVCQISPGCMTCCNLCSS